MKKQLRPLVKESQEGEGVEAQSEISCAVIAIILFTLSMSESQSRSEPTIFWVENRIGICTAVGYYIAPDILTVPATPPSLKPKEDLHSLKKLIQTSGPSLALATRSPTEKAAIRPKEATITHWRKV